jgi:hypothetical protein
MKKTKKRTALTLLIEGCIIGMLGGAIGGLIGTLSVPKKTGLENEVPVIRKIYGGYDDGFEIMLPEGVYDQLEYEIIGTTVGNVVGMVGYYAIVGSGYLSGRKKET